MGSDLQDSRNVKDGTRVSLKMEYTIPVVALGKIAEKILLKQNEKAADEGTANLRRLLEG
jgi:uncharacterized membrane protein